MKPIAVIGAGAFGTALAIAFSQTGRQVFLWSRDPAAVRAMQDARQNAKYLPHIPFPSALRPIADLRELPMDALQVLSVPAQQTDGFLQQYGDALPDAPLVLTAKGIDLSHTSLQSDIVARTLPKRRIAVLSGPGFAGEVARGLPTAFSLACADDVLGTQLQDRLSTPVLRFYRTKDIIGVQLGGALKNVVALACGMCDGAALGESARAALMTRGFAEMTRLGSAMGANAATFSGLSGLGDLALTCSTLQSRNFAAGRALGQAGKIEPGQTVEGVATAHAVLTLAKQHKVDMPIAEAVSMVLEGEIGIAEAMKHLLSRPLKEEN